jgi:hypothetical protein
MAEGEAHLHGSLKFDLRWDIVVVGKHGFVLPAGSTGHMLKAYTGIIYTSLTP